MQIITLTCPDCGTIVAANELEHRRLMKCPARSCQRVLRFADLDSDDRTHFLEHRDRYEI